MKTIPLSAVLNQEDDGYVSLCTELDIASQISPIEEALSNLKEAYAVCFLMRSFGTASKMRYLKIYC